MIRGGRLLVRPGEKVRWSTGRFLVEVYREEAWLSYPNSHTLVTEKGGEQEDFSCVGSDRRWCSPLVHPGGAAWGRVGEPTDALQKCRKGEV
jgi:hypothetical protein